MRLDHLLSRENALDTKVDNGLPRSSIRLEGNREKDVRNKRSKDQGRKAKDTDWPSHLLYRFEGSKEPSPHLENCTGKVKRKDRSQFYSSKHSVPHSSLVLGGSVWTARSSEQERRVNARALIAEEGRDKLRKAAGSRK